MKKHKSSIIIIAVILIILMLIPVKLAYKDGGTIKYQAVLWSVTKWRKILGVKQYYVATEVRILFFSFKFNERIINPDNNPVPDVETTTLLKLQSVSC